MKIDLRYIIPIVMFYVPGILLIFGSWFLGFPLEESRHVISFVGGFAGTIAALASIINMFDRSIGSGCEPIWFTLWEKENKND